MKTQIDTLSLPHRSTTSHPAIESLDFSSAVDKELDMGFLSNPFTDNAACSGDGCQRINYCSCDCNHACLFK